MSSDDTNKEEQSGQLQTSLTTFGIVQPSRDFVQSYERHDGAGMAVSALAVAGNATSLTLNVLQKGQQLEDFLSSHLTELGSASAESESAEVLEDGLADTAGKLEMVSKYAPVLTAVNIAYQTYREDGSSQLKLF